MVRRTRTALEKEKGKRNDGNLGRKRGRKTSGAPDKEQKEKDIILSQ